jgi:hypothetical protein
MDSVVERRKQDGLRTAAQQPGPQPYQIRSAQSCQRAAAAFPPLHTSYIHAELLG